jgi:hypothetical protein
MRKIIITILLLAVPATPAHSKSNIEQRCPKWEPLMQKYNLPIKGKVNFSYLAWRESRCIPQSVGWNLHKEASLATCPDGRYHVMRKCAAVKSWDVGILQINSSWFSLTKKLCGHNTRSRVLMKPDCNLRVASYLYHHGGGAANWGYPSDKPSREL